VSEPLFAGIGLARRRAPAPRGFFLFIALGVGSAIFAAVWRYTHPPPELVVVPVDLTATPARDAEEERAAWEARTVARTPELSEKPAR
jgi:hypothetical protein